MRNAIKSWWAQYFGQQSAEPFRAGLLNTGELVVIDRRGHVHLYQPEDAKVLYGALAHTERGHD